MKLPKKVCVRETWWEIKKKAMKDYGACCPTSRTIYIKKGLSAYWTHRTLIHEMLHAAEFEYNYDIGHRLINRLEEWLMDAGFRVTSLSKDKR